MFIREKKDAAGHAATGHNVKIGKIGENKSANYLARRGYEILERNYRVQGGEIDIIAEKKGCICFVEVKTRTNDKFGAPVDAVNYYKRQNLMKAAKTYLYRHEKSGGACRFDIMEVFYNPKSFFGRTKINHLKNVEF
jgi:putative endonuclease